MRFLLKDTFSLKTNLSLDQAVEALRSAISIEKKLEAPKAWMEKLCFEGEVDKNGFYIRSTSIRIGQTPHIHGVFQAISPQQLNIVIKLKAPWQLKFTALAGIGIVVLWITSNFLNWPIGNAGEGISSVFLPIGLLAYFGSVLNTHIQVSKHKKALKEIFRIKDLEKNPD